MRSAQTTNAVLMVRPAAFGPNSETKDSNTFQVDPGNEEGDQIVLSARSEFNEFVVQLRDAGIRVLVANDTPNPTKPDAVFPNNWLSFHENGRAALFPMMSIARRHERRMDVLDAIRAKFHLTEAVDYSGEERVGRYLEGTGSMVLDRENKIAFACRSPRTDPDVLLAFCNDFGFEPFIFDALDREGSPIYHTNVALSIGKRFAVVCLQAAPAAQQAELVRRLSQGGRQLIPIDYDQLERFAGNILELEDSAGGGVIAMSLSAYESFLPSQIEDLSAFGAIVCCDLETIERYGGGSARCMICEIFLEEKDDQATAG